MKQETEAQPTEAAQQAPTKKGVKSWLFPLLVFGIPILAMIIAAFWI